MKYTYTAVFTPTEDGTEYYASVPDLPGCITTGDTLEDALEQISDAMSIWLVAAEDEERAIPAPTAQGQIAHTAESVFSLVQADTIAYRAQIDTRAVRKNVSLPAWMASMADRRGINCSQVLQESLLQRLS